jgi:hypothetical protein
LDTYDFQFIGTVFRCFYGHGALSKQCTKDFEPALDIAEPFLRMTQDCNEKNARFDYKSSSKDDFLGPTEIRLAISDSQKYKEGFKRKKCVVLNLSDLVPFVGDTNTVSKVKGNFVNDRMVGHVVIDILDLDSHQSSRTLAETDENGRFVGFLKHFTSKSHQILQELVNVNNRNVTWTRIGSSNLFKHDHFITDNFKDVITCDVISGSYAWNCVQAAKIRSRHGFPSFYPQKHFHINLDTAEKMQFNSEPVKNQVKPHQDLCLATLKKYEKTPLVFWVKGGVLHRNAQSEPVKLIKLEDFEGKIYQYESNETFKRVC